jgi:hypothetical protein
MNVTGKQISRHTPDNRLKAYLSSSIMNKVAANVMSSIFNPDRLKTIDFESVVYWQNINKPLDMKAKPTYLKVSDGSLVESETDVTVTGLLGVLFDEDAMGVVIKHDETAASPYNPRGRYYNMFYAYNHQYWNDFTENVIALYAADQEYFLTFRHGAGARMVKGISMPIGSPSARDLTIGVMIGDVRDRDIGNVNTGGDTKQASSIKGAIVSVTSGDTDVVKATSLNTSTGVFTCTPVAVGSTTITVVATIDGTSHTFVYPVTITDNPTMNTMNREDSLETIQKEDQQPEIIQKEDQPETKTTRSKKA